MVTEKIPLVSVIMPMYNSAKFIPQTLESLLYQTMKNFEVIIIDDCSTDNSVEVVESFAQRFATIGIALRGIKLSKNTGTPGIPRNVGIKVARGKYIAFLDSDDFYTKTALEELTTLAEKYQADIVHVDDTYGLFKGKGLSPDDPRMTNLKELTNPANFSISNWRYPVYSRPKTLSAPTLKPDTLEERVKFWAQWNYRSVTYANFCRREFLIENNIIFPNIVVDEDFVFGFACLCLAKNFLRAPNVYYIIRPRAGSLSREEMNIQYDEKYLNKWFNVIKGGFRELNNFMDRIPFFGSHEELRFGVLNLFFMRIINFRVADKYKGDYNHLFYQMVKKEFSAENAELVAFLLNMINVYRLKIKSLDSSNQKLQKENHKLKGK